MSGPEVRRDRHVVTGWLISGTAVLLAAVLGACAPGQGGSGLLVRGPQDQADVRMDLPPAPASGGGSGQGPVSSAIGAPGPPGVPGAPGPAPAAPPAAVGGVPPLAPAAGGPSSGGSAGPGPGPGAAVAPVNRPAGTAGVKWGPEHHVIVSLDLSGMVPSGQYPLGLYSAACGVAGHLLESFPPAAASARGADDQTIFSLATTGAGIPAGSSVRLGPPGSSDASSGLSCGTVVNAITQTGRATDIQMR
jgi:hypothetical protein